MKTIRTILNVVLSAALGGGCADRSTPTVPRVPGADAAAAGPNGGSLVELSRPNAVGTCNTGFNAFGTWPTDEAEEPYVAVNPVHPNNIVAAWTQGPFQDIIAAASFDGGQTWQQVPLPLTVCSGGPFLGTGDEWLSFAPNGVLYALATAGNSSASRVEQVMRSTDGGLHWTASLVPGSSSVDPPADHPSLTADPTNPAFVYAIWNGTNSPHSTAAVFARTTDGGSTWEPARAIFQTAEHSFFQYNDIAFSMSADGGFSWSAPIRVNQTPLNIPPANRQAFHPFIAVAANGTIGVSYYDFRLNDPNPGLPTDYWLVQCHPVSTGPATDPACWDSEVRLTTSSFNMEAVVPVVAGEFFLGDYFGLAAAGNDFVATFIQPDRDNVTSAFFARNANK